MYSFLLQRVFDLKPSKSQVTVFSRNKSPVYMRLILIDKQEVPKVNTVRLLGLHLDSKLSGKTHFKYLINKGHKIVNVIFSLTGTKWCSHPQALITLYRSLFRSVIEYASQVFCFCSNKTLVLKIRRLQYRALRLAYSYRASTPINVIMCESRERAPIESQNRNVG